MSAPFLPLTLSSINHQRNMSTKPKRTPQIDDYTKRIYDAKTLQELISAYDDAMRDGFTFREINREYERTYNDAARTYDSIKTAAKAESGTL